MPTGTWALGWATNDVVSAAEFAKGVGCIYDTTSAGAASIDATSLVGTYAHLLVIAYLRSDTAAQSTGVIVRLNNDSGANYGSQHAFASGVTASSTSSITDTSLFGGVSVVPGASSPASGLGALVIVIPHYAGTANFKSATMDGGFACGSATTDNRVSAAAGIWRSAVAVNRITVSLGAGNIVSGSRLSIYAMGA